MVDPSYLRKRKCCRKGDPFQGPKLGSCLILRNELSEETHALTKREILLAKDNLETNPITIKPKTSSHVAELSSWVPLPYCSPPRCPFPIKSLALLALVSPRTIHFQVLDKSQVSWKRSLSLQQYYSSPGHLFP